MKKIYLLFLSVALFQSIQSSAQWDTITKFNQVIDDLKTFESKLFIVGGFTKNYTNNCYWSAYYNGSTVSCHANMIGGSGINKVDIFNNELYSVDALDYGGAMGVGMWDGSTWTDGGSTNYNHTMIYADNNDLYVYGTDGNLRKKTGAGSFSLFMNFATGGISSMCRYNGKLIFAGSFSSIGGVAANNIAAYDGSTWTPLGTGISTGASCMVVFNNELYVAGTLSTAGGSTVKKMAKWNGAAWSAVGGGVTGTCNNGLRDMVVFNNGLYVVGDFDQMGGVNTNDIALWKNSQWYGMGLTHDDSFLNCVEAYNNKIYVGSFDFSHSHVFRYSGTIGMEDNEASDLLSIFPNPASTKLSITAPSKSEIEIYNIEGQCMMKTTSEDNTTTLDISAFAPGMYFAKVKTEAGIAVRKFVKQ